VGAPAGGGRDARDGRFVSPLIPLLLGLAVMAWPPVPERAVESPDVTGRTSARTSARTSGRWAGRSAAATATVTDVANAIELLGLALRGGTGLVEAIEAVAGQLGGPLREDLETVTAALRWGVGDRAAWSSVPSAWQPAARALRMAAEVGVAPAELLQRAAEDMREAEQQRLGIAAARLGVRVVLPLGLAFLPAFVLTTVVPVVLALAQQVLGRS
jgi:Flp pilus assembly protein TadB